MPNCESQIQISAHKMWQVRTEKSCVSHGSIMRDSHGSIMRDSGWMPQVITGLHGAGLMKWIKSNCTADHNNIIDSSSFDANIRLLNLWLCT